MMNILKTYTLAASAALLVSGAAVAQNADRQTQGGDNGYVNNSWQPSLVKDGVIDRVPHVTRITPWQYIREADVMWKKRIWMEIDAREKQNMPFRYAGDENTGGGFFIEILLDAIKKGKIKAYSNFDDRFTTALTKEQVTEMLVGTSDTTYVEDPVTGERKMVVTKRDFDPDAITKYRLKKDVYFDRNLGRMQSRIIGIAPFKDILNEDGTYRASQALFWLYYPEIQPLLAQYEVFNPDNDIDRITWYDFFESNMFAARIIKVSNPFDMSFKEQGYSNMESLYEGQNTMNILINKEHDMWVY